MTQNKRQRYSLTDNCNDDIKKKKLQSTSLFSSITSNTYKSSINQFENLSNEVIYEIFEFLNVYQLYESFFDLNTRFRNLCIYSNLPIEINNQSLSKSTFQRYYTNLILPNKHRIRSLDLSDPFIIDFFSLSTEDISKYFQLQTLILEKMESGYLENLLTSLTSLPNLSSLIISIGLGSNTNTLWNLIFQLPVLKYCKISSEENTYLGFLPMSTHTISSIEHLVINSKLDYTHIDAILSYVPQLRRLSINYLYTYYRGGIHVLPFASNNLTYVSLILDHLMFDQFEMFVKNYLSRIKVLYISSNYDSTYLNAEKWENLILSHMSYLQIFDLQHTYEIFYRNKQKIMYENIFQKFTTPFWIKRQWFFAHDTNFGSPLRGIFYSVQPYKRKCFTLTGESNLDEHPSHDKTIFDSVHHVIIQDERMIENCSKYFPNANQLTISDQRTDRAKRSTIISIDDIIPLIQLTKLTIDYSHRPFSKVIDLLYSTPNVDRIVLKHLSLVATDYFPLQHSEKFRLVSKHNKIKNVTILFDYSLRNIQLLMNLCPKVRQISFGISESYLESTVQFFVSETKKTNWYLSSICIFGVDTVINEKLKSLIESEKFINDYSIKIIGRTFYLWW
ncbi:unnamed protein product [Rotaria sordida]|uniref:F-box domain-containing protein n=1 Tax=Rotaria sordida TaxID=392033 RepID=A0A815A0T7_9BILA|nr:unnamed protein product [Rotaria sordida]CAF1530020.1 unnamed protein product [Rotaria sordida]